MKFIKNYKSTLILLLSIIIGAIIGLIFGSKTTILKPLGDIFINLLFVVIVPLIFLTITSSIIKMDSPKRLGKIMSRIVITFIIMSLIASLIGIVVTKNVNLVEKNNSDLIGLLDENSVVDNDLSLLERTASLLTVSDFNLLLSKDSIIPLLLISIIFGLALRSASKGERVKEVILGLNETVLKMINYIMYYAPIGLGCYIASLIGTYGSTIAMGFLKTFIVYTLTCLFVYFIVYSLYIILVSGVSGLKRYWLNILPPTITSLATCSSAASIPVNVTSTKKMGISSDICEATIPMGTSFHKDGSVIGSVFKVMFLVYLFNIKPSLGTIILVSILATLLITAVPVGGGTISEAFILSFLGLPVSALPILTIIATIIDAPATVLNVVGDSASSFIVSRMVDGKNFLKVKD